MHIIALNGVKYCQSKSSLGAFGNSLGELGHLKYSFLLHYHLLLEQLNWRLYNRSFWHGPLMQTIANKQLIQRGLLQKGGKKLDRNQLPPFKLIPVGKWEFLWSFYSEYSHELN